MELNDFMQDANIYAIVPIVVALVQVAKMLNLPNKFAPVVSIVSGVILAILFNDETFMSDWGSIILQGVIYGLSASGLYSGVKTTAHAVKGEQNVDHL